MSDLISRQAIIDAIQKLNIPEDMCVFEIISHIEVAIATLPSVENKGDLISRQAVIDKLNRLIEVEKLQGTDEMGYGRERVSAYEYMIHEVESEYLHPFVQPKKGEWNPLKSDEEGMIIGSLPEEGEEVLVTVYGQVEIDSFGCDVEYDESIGECRYEWFCENNNIEDVRAWMPKPKPYKEERGE